MGAVEMGEKGLGKERDVSGRVGKGKGCER
jgi:hypothetical protein